MQTIAKTNFNVTHPVPTQTPGYKTDLTHKGMPSLIRWFFVLLMMAGANTYAQNVNVNPGAGTYPTLKAAFDAINAGTHTGAVIVDVVASTTETASAVLNASGAGSASYTSIVIAPSGGAWTLNGAVAGYTVDLNGADNVTIDGLNSGGNALTITNTTTGASGVLRFIGDASNNIIQNTTLQGSSSTASNGVVFFSTGTTTGNDGNNINNCGITAAGANLPINAIFSQGSSAIIDNSGNTLNANNISDYFSATLVSTGINLGTFNSGWSITGNRLFQTATRIYTASQTHSGINIGSGAGYTITGNIIGFANSGGTGTTNIVGNSVALTGTFPSSYTTTGTANATRYIAIGCSFAAGGAVSSIQNNTIAGFALYTSSGATTDNGIWCGIRVTAGNVNIGTTTGNTIGATSGLGSVYTACTSTGGTAVGISVASVNTVAIQNNTIGAIDAVGTTASINGGFAGIDASGSGGVFSITNNIIGNTTADNIRTGYTLNGGSLSNSGSTLTSTSSATGGVVGIRNASSGATLSISTNTIQGIAVSSTSVAVTGITNTGALTTTITLNGNLLGGTAAAGFVRYAFANSGALVGITNSAGASLSTLTINNNDIRGISQSVTGSNSQTYIRNTSGNPNSTINGNTFTNLTVNTTGLATFIGNNVTHVANSVHFVNNNSIVTQYTKNGNGSANVLFYDAFGTSPATVTETNTGNNFSNVTLTGATTLAGWRSADGTTSNPLGSRKTVTNNTFNNITMGTGAISSVMYTGFSDNTFANTNISGNTISNINSGGTVIGFISDGGNQNFFSNTITNISTTGTGITAIQYTGAGIQNCYKNTICNLQTSNAAGSTAGIFITAGTTFNIYNNRIADLRAPITNSASFNVIGIASTSTTTSSAINISHNSIYLSASSTGAQFNTTCVFHTTNATATTATLNMRNNILINNSTPGGSGFMAAFVRSNNTFTNYGSTSNRNLFYAGTPGIQNVIYIDGTNISQTLAAYQAIAGLAPRDANSVSENTTFLSTTCGSADFLKVNTAVATVAESGGASVAGITDDFEGETRGATPDIGADEFAGTSPAPVITNVSVPTGACTAAAHVITADIVPTAGTLTTVTLNYNNGAAGSTAMTFVSGTQYTGTIPVASPTNAPVTWSITATNSAAVSSTVNGTSYTDDPLFGITGLAVASVNPVCSGSPTSLSVTLQGGPVPAAPAASTYCQSTHTSGCSGDNITQVVLNTLASTASACGLTGSTPPRYLYVTGGGANTTTLTASTLYNITLSFGSDGTQFFGAWIDYNHDGVYAASENLGLSGNAGGGGTTFVSFTVPAGAYNGLTHMRVIGGNDNPLLATDACGASSSPWGETQDFDITIAGGLSNLPYAGTITGYSWSDGVGVVGTTNPLSVSPTTSTTYSATVTVSGGCTVTSNTVAVNVNALPTAPGASNSVQCGSGVPEAFVTTGGGGGGFKWYNAQTGGTLLQTGGATYLGSISITTSFWVSESNGSCESLRTEVVASVNPPDPIAASSDGPVCQGTNLTLTATVTSGTNGNNYTYSWAATPSSGSGIPTTQAGGTGTFGSPASTVVTPTAAGTYTYTVTGTDGDCVTNANVIVTIKALPTINTPTAVPATVCAGVNSTLTATTNTIAPVTQQIGNGTGSNANNTTIGAFYGTWYGNGHAQILIRASELTALGFVAGNLTSLSINVSAVAASPDDVVNGFTIKLASTASTAITTFQAPTFTTVYGPANYTPVVGLNTHNFIAPYAWDGTSNIIVDYCYANGITGNGAAVNTITTTAFGSFVNHQEDGAISGICTNTVVSNASTSRPNIRFSGLGSTPGAGTVNWTWNPGSLSGNIQIVTPSVTTTYTVTATDPVSTCSNTATVTVTVNPLPPAPSAADGTDQCGTGVSDMSVSSNNITDPQVPPFFRWYDAPSGGVLKQSGTSTIYTTPISVTTTLYVAEVSINGCEGPRSLITTVVSSPDPLTVTVTGNDTQLCLGESTDITSAYTPDFNNFATFDLTAAGGAGSGVTGTVSLTANPTGSNPYTITPTTAGTYTYTITAFDPDKGCTSIGTIVVNVGANPLISAYTATPATVCAGDQVTLAAESVIGGPGVATVGIQSGTIQDGSPFRAGGGAAAKTQLLYTAAELTAAGLTSGNITSIGFNFTSTSGGTLPNFTISMGHTAATALTSTFEAAPGTVVYAPATVVPPAVTGMFTLTFTTPFNWNGTSNLLIQFCHDLPTGSAGSGFLAANTPAAISTNQTLAACSSTTGTTFTLRPLATFGAVIGNNQTGTYNWSWNPGALSGPSVNVNPTTSTVYTVTATNPVTLCSSTQTVSVTVNPIPAAPVSGGDAERCGPGPVTVSATGAGGTLNWYDASTGGNLLQAGGNSYTTGVTGNTTFYVSETSAFGCVSPRTAINAVVTTAPVLVINASGATTFCLGGSVGLSTSPGTDPSYTNFVWSSSPSIGGGLSSTSGASVTATPTVSGSIVYTVVADDGNPNGCQNTETITITVNALPVITSATANPATSCPNGAVTLTATTPAVGPGLASSIGTGSSTTSDAGITPFNSNWEGTRVQYIIRASELTAAGLQPGNLTSLAFDVSSSGAGTFNQEGYTIKIAHTAQTAFSGAYATPTGSFTQVLNPTSVAAPAVGLRTFTFDAPFAWDGTSNIVVDICHDNDIDASCPGCFSGSSTVKYTTTAYNSVYGMYGDDVQACDVLSTNSIFTFTSRPNMIFAGQIVTGGAGGLNWVWNPGNVSGAVVTVNPIVTTTYTVTATNPVTLCTNTATVPVTVIPVAANATATPNTPVCAGTSVTLNSGGTGGGTLTYAWTDGTATVYPATTSISVAPTITTTYTVTVTDGCGNPITSTVTVNVIPKPTASIQEGPGPISLCSPATQTLTAVTDAGAATYQWTLNGTNITLNGTNPTYVVSGVASGTYAVIVTNTATTCISSPSTGVVVTINPQPSAITIAPPSATICNGGSVGLVASGGTIGGTATLGTGSSTTTAATTGSGLGPNPMQSYYGGSKQQIIVRASELAAQGLAAGSSITAITFNMSAVEARVLQNYVVKMQHTALTAFTSTSFVIGGFTTVRNAANLTPVVGVNTITLNTPFVWNGSANLLIETNQSNGDFGGSGTNTSVFSTTSFASTLFYRTDGSSAASVDATTTASFAAYSSRNNIQFVWSIPTTFSWAPAGGLNTTTGTTVTANPSSTTTYTVTAVTAAACSNAATVTVTVNPRPTGTISGSGAFCQGAANTSTNLSIAFTGTAPWNYTYTVNGGSPVSGTTSSNPLTVTVAPSSASPALFTYAISALSDANCSSIAADLSGSGTVTINPLAAAPTASVTQPTCVLGTGTITVTAPLGTGNSYTLDGGTTITWPTVSFPGVAPGPHTITVTNSFGCSAPASASVTVDPQPFAPGTPVITGVVNVCPYLGTATQQTYTAAVTGNGSFTYTWTLPPNVTLVSGGGTNSTNNFVTVTFGTGLSNPAQANKQIRVVATNQCGISPIGVFYLLTQAPVTPGPITGPTNVCALIGTATTATYTINKVLAATGYSWSVPSNASFTEPNGAGPNDTTIVVTFPAGFAGGVVSVAATNNCGANAVRTLTIVNAPPSTPALIAGPTNACPHIAPGGTAATYSVAAVAFATSYTWTAPAGAVVTHPNGVGANDNTITVLYPAGFISGAITVTATNGCGTSGVRSLSITKLNPGTPSVIDVIQTHFCGEPGGRKYTYTLASMPANATSVLWTIPTGAGISFINLTPTSIEVTYPDGAVNGTVTAQGVNNCGISSVRSTTVHLPVCATEFAGTNNTNNGTATVKGNTILPTAEVRPMEVKIFPNPTVSDFKLEVLTSRSEEINVRVLDNLGKLYKSFKLMPHQVIALGAELKAGSYFIEVRQGAEVKTSKVIKF